MHEGVTVPCAHAAAHDVNATSTCLCSYEGVTVLRNQPAILMPYYSRGSLAMEIEGTYGDGLELQRALR
jgi:hypothetical protein